MNRLSDRLCFTQELPFIIRKEFMNAPECDTPEQFLWREVSARMVLDALGMTGLSEPPKHLRAMQEARDWFDLPEFSDDVRKTFDYGGVDLERIRTLMADIIRLTPVEKRYTSVENKPGKVVIVEKRSRKLKACQPAEILQSPERPSNLPGTSSKRRRKLTLTPSKSRTKPKG